MPLFTACFGTAMCPCAARRGMQRMDRMHTYAPGA